MTLTLQKAISGFKMTIVSQLKIPDFESGSMSPQGRKPDGICLLIPAPLFIGDFSNLPCDDSFS
ncbi:hypothetical protein CBD41_08630 [bacterium TMED181]|nr:hypothetical protein [Planctomycetota bacterium]OUW42689.1 MAG: hypothetical protein CBD41_08630 [bacterium TMED181]